MNKLYYIANVRLPTEKAHGIQIMEMCQAFVDSGMEVELVIPDRKTVIDGRVINEDPYRYYGVREVFKIKKLWCLDLVKWGRSGFIIQSLSFAFHGAYFSLVKEGVFYTRDEVIATLFKLMGKKVVWEAHMGHKNFLTFLIIKMKVPVVAITHGLKNLYCKMGVAEENLLVAPDGVNLEKFSIKETKAEAREKLGLKQDIKIILYTGHLYEWKGVSVLAETARLNSVNGLFMFIGGTDKHVRSFQEKYGGFPNIKILGRKSHSEIPLYLRAADVLVLPNSAKVEISRLYTSPMKLFEYMASGTPIIASNIPSLREILGNGEAYFFEADNSDSLFESIERALGEKNETLNKAERALEKVRNYSWSERSKKIIKFIS